MIEKASWKVIWGKNEVHFIMKLHSRLQPIRQNTYKNYLLIYLCETKLGSLINIWKLSTKIKSILWCEDFWACILPQNIYASPSSSSCKVSIVFTEFFFKFNIIFYFWNYCCCCYFFQMGVNQNPTTLLEFSVTIYLIDKYQSNSAIWHMILEKDKIEDQVGWFYN